MLKPFSGEKILSRRNGAQKWRFLGKMGVETLILVSRPPKGTSLRGTASFDVFCVKICARVSAVAFLKDQKIAESLLGREITHAQNRNPLTDLDKILHGGRYPRHSYLH